MADAKRSTTTTSSSSSSSKSRKSKNELIRNVLGTYLKQRNYTVTDRFRRSDLILTQSTEQIVMNTAIKNDISKVNSFLFSNIFCLNNHPASVDQHFVKFANYIKNQTETIRDELSDIIQPLLCHLYIEMLKGRDWRPAIEFLRKYAPLVGKIEAPTTSNLTAGGSSPLFLTNQKINGTVDDQQTTGGTIPSATVQSSAIIFSATTVADSGRLTHYKHLIQQLSHTTRFQDCETDPLIVHFRCCQSVIRLSSGAIVALRHYLSMYAHSLILQILRTWFYFDTVDDKDFVDYNPDVGRKPTGRQAVRGLHGTANGTANGLSMDAGEENGNHDDCEYDFDEHTPAENERYLLLNGFSTNYVRYRLRDTVNGGADMDGLSTMDLEEDDEDDDLLDGAMVEEKPVPAPVTANVPVEMTAIFQQISSQERLKRLQDSSEKLSRYHHPLCIYNLENVGHRLTSAAVDSGCCHLASGFEDSSIILWSANRATQMGRKPYTSFRDTQCCWNVTACDSRFSESEEEEEDEEEDDGAEVGDGQGRNRDRRTGLQNHFRFKTKADIDRINRLLPPYNRRLPKRERWKQFHERRCTENTFSDAGGVTLRGHSNAVTDLLFSEYSPLLMSVSRDLTMRAWSASDYNCRAVYRGHSHPIWCVTESSTGLYLATGSKDTTARLWSTDHQFPLQIYSGHTQDVDAVAFHPNGNYLATGSADLTVRLWCVTSGKLFRIFTDCRQPVQRVCFSPDGKYLAAGGEEHRIRIFDLAAGSQITELKDHTSSVTCMSWSTDSRHFVSSCTDGTIRVWDALRMVPSGTTPVATTTSSYASSPGGGTLNNGTIGSSNATTVGNNSNSNNNNNSNHSNFNPKTNITTGTPGAGPSGQSVPPPSSSTGTASNLLLAYSTGCRKIFRLHYNKFNGGLACIGNS